MRFAALLVAAVACAQTHPAIQGYLQKPGFAWQCERDEHFELCWETSLAGDRFLAAARESAAPAFTGILRFARAETYAPRIHVFFLASPERMEKLIGYHGEGRSRPAQHAIFFVPTEIRPDLAHELTHEILSNLWGPAEAWIEEGMAAHLAQGRALRSTCISLSVQRALLPLTPLVSAAWNPTVYSPELTYPQLGDFVDFLERRYGLDRVKQVWQGGAESIAAAIGKPLTILEAEWRADLDRDAAAARGQ